MKWRSIPGTDGDWSRTWWKYSGGRGGKSSWWHSTLERNGGRPEIAGWRCCTFSWPKCTDQTVASGTSRWSVPGTRCTDGCCPSDYKRPQAYPSNNQPASIEHLRSWGEELRIQAALRGRGWRDNWIELISCEAPGALPWQTENCKTYYGMWQIKNCSARGKMALRFDSSFDDWYSFPTGKNIHYGSRKIFGGSNFANSLVNKVSWDVRDVWTMRSYLHRSTTPSCRTKVVVSPIPHCARQLQKSHA